MALTIATLYCVVGLCGVALTGWLIYDMYKLPPMQKYWHMPIISAIVTILCFSLAILTILFF